MFLLGGRHRRCGAAGDVPEAGEATSGMSEPALTCWGAIVSEHRSEDWPPEDWSLSAEEEREESVRSCFGEPRWDEVR
jgi:hypothetical protein